VVSPGGGAAEARNRRVDRGTPHGDWLREKALREDVRRVLGESGCSPEGLSAVLRFTQEHRSNVAAERLKRMAETTAAETRVGVSRAVPIEEIVPGDIVHLSAADTIPADL